MKAVVLHKMHWKRVGSAGNAKEWATAHFRVSVTTVDVVSRQDLAVGSEFSVVTEYSVS